MRVSPEGKVRNAQPFPAAAGKAIDLVAGWQHCFWRALSGITAKKKYTGDKVRGVYMALLKADLSMKWDTVFASESNSEVSSLDPGQSN